MNYFLPGSVNTHWGAGPVNTNWGPGTGAGAEGQAKSRGPRNTTTRNLSICISLAISKFHSRFSNL